MNTIDLALLVLDETVQDLKSRGFDRVTIAASGIDLMNDRWLQAQAEINQINMGGATGMPPNPRVEHALAEALLGVAVGSLLALDLFPWEPGVLDLLRPAKGVA